MADNYNNRNNSKNNKDDIDEFFAQFDRPVQNRSANAQNGASRSSRQPSSARRSQPQRRSQQQRNTANASRSDNVRRQPDAARTSSANSQRSGQQRNNHAAPSRAQHSNAQKPKNSTKSKRPFGFGGSGGGGKKSFANEKPQSLFKKIIKTVVLACLALIMGVGVYAGIVIVTAPNADTDNLYDMLSQRSVLYDSEGNEIDNLYFSDGNRTILSYDEIPEDMVNAVVSIEDRKFWDHSGFNFVRMAGAVVDSVFGGGQISGTSTITQQLARNVYLSDIKSQRSLSRKITEAYYTIILEKNLTKEEIMEAYLNTIFLGFNSYGIQAASQAYFSKDTQDLTTLECAALAALPQSPDSYALVKTDYNGSGSTSGLPVISSTDSVTYLYNGDISETRRNAVINNMAEEGYISSEERDNLLSENLADHIKIGVSADADESSYFTDYAIDQLTEDIISEYGISCADARDMIYTNGLKIYTTMDSDIQAIVEDEFADDSNYSGISSVRRNSDGDILNENGNIMLYDYSHYFNDDDEFTLESDEYEMNSDGSMTIFAGNRLNIYDIEVNGQPDVSIEFDGMYTQEDGSFYFIEGGALSIPQGYTTTDNDGNAVISAQFFKDYPDFFTADGDSYVVSSANYSLKQRVRQPQAATVIMENSTGEIKAMVGGRGTKGSQLFNRATSERQPGSVMKPISVYGPALQMSYEYVQDNKTMKLDSSDGSDWGNYITAGSIINDQPIQYNGRNWPKNWYSGYRGQMTLRHAVEQSVNTCAVKTYQQIGADYSVSMLKKSGVTSIVEEGDTNDLNPSALALGGMTKGISPLEVTAAYATFVNEGVYKSPIAYTQVLNSNDEVLFEKTSEEERVYNEGVAWIMTDILRTVVTNGLGSSAAISNQPVAGKTGTTTDSYDLWFCGFTPQYTAALWMGNDINIELSAGSSRVAGFWQNIMSRVCEDLPRGSFAEKPSDVTTVNGEYYIEGTYSNVSLSQSGDSGSDSATSAVSSATESISRATTTQPEPTTPESSESPTSPTSGSSN